MKRIVLVLILCAFALSSCGVRGGKKAADSQTDSIARENMMRQKMMEEPEFDLVTTKGTMRIKLYSKTPKHRDNFVKLVNENFFDGIRFHRIIEGFMIQTGDPMSRDSALVDFWGQGGPEYTIPAEFVNEYWHKKGAIAAARKGDMVNPTKASSGSQFYIVHDENACLHLDGQYSIFGEVIHGLEIIDEIARVETDMYDRPSEDIRIIKISPVMIDLPVQPADSVAVETPIEAPTAEPQLDDNQSTEEASTTAPSEISSLTEADKTKISR